MLLKFEHLGEKTINKIAEVALSTQLKKTEQLRVNVKTDPNLLAQGMLESLAIDCQGLIVEQSLRLETITITLNTIMVSPLKALMGNIQLTKPSEGKACILLTEADITSAFDTKIIKSQPTQAKIEGKLIQVTFQTFNVQLLDTGKILVSAQVNLENTRGIREVSLQMTPHICQLGNGVIIEDVEYLQEPTLSSVILQPIIEEAEKIFNLKNFRIDGFFLKVQDLKIMQGALKLKANAGMTHFPAV